MRAFLMIVLAGCAVAAYAALPDNGGYSFSDVTAVSQLPWDRRVTVNFTVTPPVGVPANGILRLDVIVSNGLDRVYVSDDSIYGGNYCTASGSQTLVWDPTVDHAGVALSDVTFHFAVAETNVTFPPYLSVHLADGKIGYHGMAITNRITDERFLADYMVFRRIPATTTDEWITRSGKDTFTYGATSNDCAHLYKTASDFIKEQPREVKLTKDFYLAVYPLTFGQLERLGFTRQDSYVFNGEYNMVATGMSYDFLRGADTTSQYNFPATSDVAPDSLVGVLRTRTGLNFDLPTDAQWDYACKAGSTNAYWFTETDVLPSSETLANRVQSAIVTRFPPNAWGLYAMVGCCHQWTTTLGRTSDDANLNSWSNHNFVIFDEEAVDPAGPVPSYSSPYRIVHGAHYSVGGAQQAMWDGVVRAAAYRLYRTAYRLSIKSNQRGGDINFSGARLSLTLP